MRILLACYSRTGHTARVAEALRARLEAQGHAVALERIELQREPSKWRLVPPLWTAVPLFPLYMGVRAFRRWWFRRYPQKELPIRPLRFPDVSAFDLICLGGPKWLYIAYPVARYLNQVSGLEGKPVAAFATFCGPPLPVFEVEMLFAPLQHRIEARGARLAARLFVSSHFHEFFFRHEMEWLFRLVSRLVFRRPLRAFTLESAWGQRRLEEFCAAISAQAVQRAGEASSPQNLPI